MKYTSVYQQQQTAHGMYQISSTVGIDWLSWGKICCDRPWEFSAIKYRG